MSSSPLDDEPKWVCAGCIGESFLQREIGKSPSGQCSYCDEADNPRITLEVLAEHVEEAFESHYERTPQEPSAYEYALSRDREIDYFWEREGDPVLEVIAEALSCEQSVAADVLELLSEKYAPYDPSDAYDESDFDPDSHYRQKRATGGDWDEMWSRLEHVLKHESRLFNQEALVILNSVFAGLDRARKLSRGLAIVSAGPGKKISALYRAREFRSGQSLQDALENPVERLGPPPGPMAAAGRMNSSGIAVFYGALNVRSALAEVRPVVGSNVVTAKFDIIRPLRLLDLRALERLRCEGSIFDPLYATELGRHDFLRTLSKRLVLPVMPQEQEHEYLITQAVADYLASLQAPALDGIIFPSVQDGVGVNVALFHKAARVAALDVPFSTAFHVQLAEFDPDSGDEYPSYSIQIDLPASPIEEPPLTFPFKNYDWSQVYASHREPSLRLDLDTLQVHAIEAVKVKAKTQNVMVTKGVTRQRWDGPFDDLSF
ncbi:RES domain-containing protein [Pseudomonas kurunegalensis]|uniref:RES domain-containing protein n=1 Tax=Pseudomonas kurunegalensis TaxID=485880 RepID=UPI0025702E36|nr:RES domain-containing protein [Pseudomonas kurunegalensis]WJD60673.1 RES domain-containing protein [Pseudomonas kurunegalensis]